MALDFVKMVDTTKKGQYYICPEFVVGGKRTDLMTRGKTFYAIWDEKSGLWSTDEETVQKLVDEMVSEKLDEHPAYKGMYMSNFSSNVWTNWQKYYKSLPDRYKDLDTKITFANTEVKKGDYISRRLSYSLEEGSIDNYDELMNTLYDSKEREKIEWAIGSIISGDSKNIQKFIVLYGGPGTGKSTVLNIIQKLFEGYTSIFEARDLTQNNNSFALENFKDNPLVAIQHDGDLSHIEDNTRLNSIVSHEKMSVNEKFKSKYTMKFNSFLFMGTNRPVHINEAKSGLIRRLIDVSPSGRTLSPTKYNKVVKSIDFELGAIAYHCLEVYKKLGIDYYSGYIPERMLSATNDFYDFVDDSYDVFVSQEYTYAESAYMLYKNYVERMNIPYPMTQRKFREELKNYFNNYQERKYIDGRSVRHFYSGFIKDKFGYVVEKDKKIDSWLKFNADKSLLDFECKDMKAQYANSSGTPNKAWKDVVTFLKEIDTSKLHYLKLPLKHIVVDFDLKDADGNKSLELNMAAASKFPPTYAEVSKSGCGIHLHYYYSGDTDRLSRIYSEDIEIKVFKGNSSLRRQFTKCNDIPIATINSGLPLKEEGKMVNDYVIKSEKALRTTIKKCLNKEIHEYTKPNIDMIKKVLDDAYNSGINYDVSDLRMAILSFAMSSSHQSEYCSKLVNKMKFKSEEASDWSDNKDQKLVFYDIEVFPNLFLVNWKYQGDNCSVVRMINPSPNDIEELCKNQLIGFNNRRYDNHILYARLMGYTIEQLYKQSQKIINNESGALFGEAYNLSYTDVYDFSAKKQSLKKWEIELGIHHQELGLPWDEPVPEELWETVAEYCDNDVIATEAVFNACQGDFLAREILAEIAGGSVNDTTNSLTTKLIFGKNKKPQDVFVYRDLSKPVFDMPKEQFEFLSEEFPEMMAEKHGEAKSLLPYFPGYKFDRGKSSYKNVEDVGEGGRVWAKPGMYYKVKVFDVASMHPHSETSEYGFGHYTKIFNDLMNARVHIKHKDFDKAGELFNGKLKPYLKDPSKAKSLANALKIAINSVYGLTAAKFENPFKDMRNKDNIVAKRGALFMIDLQEEVEKLGGNVIHIKTDSIKIENPTPEIEQFVFNFGKKYGYTFEVEHVFEKICLVNNAVYIGKLSDDDPDDPGLWTATGAQFAHPYVFKTLFSKEKIKFEDLCETKSVSTSLYLDMNENLPDVTKYETIKEYRNTNIDKLSLKARKAMEQYSYMSDEELNDEISRGHNYKFIGKVGSFCPIKENCGGGLLVRDTNGKYTSATGAKDYRWLEGEMVETLGKEKDIDMTYFNNLVDDAVNDISKFGDFEWFVFDKDVADQIKNEVPFDEE